MNDIRPPRRPQRPAVAPIVVPPATEPAATEPVPETPETKPSKKPTALKVVLGAVAGLIVLAIIAVVAGMAWYQQQLAPVDAAATQRTRVVIDTGMGPSDIGARLADEHLIRSRLAYDWYVRLHGAGGSLQAGTYSLSQRMSLPDIIDHLTSGKTDQFSITFLPGATLAQNKAVLKKAGYSDQAIKAALEKHYDGPLFAGKPADADLEGYIYGETYQFATDTTPEQILERTFDEFYTVIKDYHLEAAFRKHGLTLYKGITLASIIQREVNDPADQKQVAQVFYLRLKEGMPLGSDVTYQYAADKAGVARDPGLDSPYNTRIHKGLPPGPIATPGLSALLAAAHPAKGDYLYFLSGDDDKTYFSKTDAEHQRNIEKHCQKKCQIL